MTGTWIKKIITLSLVGSLTIPLLNGCTRQKEVDLNKPAQDEYTLVYTVDADEDGLYDFLIDIDKPIKAGDIWSSTYWYFEEDFKIPMQISLKTEHGTFLGTLYLPKGRHYLFIKDDKAPLGDEMRKAKFTFAPAKVYHYPRLVLSEAWMKRLYNKSFNGWVETVDWDDLWTHCQYVAEKYIYANLSGKKEMEEMARNSADKLLIGKMLENEGFVHTVYRGYSRTFENSRVETNMKPGFYDLWRGNAAFIEEMIHTYKHFKEEKYLDYARLAGEYVLNHWTVREVEDIGSVYTNLTQQNEIRTESIGRIVMNLCQLYEITGDKKWLDAAVAQGRAILYSQTENTGLFNSNVTGGWQHGNAYCNAINGLAWLFRVTGDDKYLDSIDKGINGLKAVWNDETGSTKIAGRRKEEGMDVYLAGRIAQSVFTAAYFTGRTDYYRMGERLLYYAFGRNKLRRDMQNEYLGSYYYLLNYDGMSNIETSSEMNLGTMQIEILRSYWGPKAGKD